MKPEVLREQFEYLLQFHYPGCGTYDCKDCARMAAIKGMLEVPFESQKIGRRKRAS